MSLNKVEKACKSISKIPINIKVLIGHTYGAQAVNNFWLVLIV